MKCKKYKKTAENDYVFKNFTKRFVRALLLALSNMLEEKLDYMAETSSPHNISAEVVKIHWLGAKLCVTAGNLYCGFAALTVIAMGRVVLGAVVMAGNM